MVNATVSVADSVTVVTGSSRGIGRTIARTFAADGGDVVLCAPEGERDALDSAAERIGADCPGRAEAVVCDVTDRGAVEALAGATVEAFGRVDALVNNAGVWHTVPFAEVTPEQWHEVLAVNLTGTYNCTQIVGERIRGSGGAIVNVASGAGLRGFPNGAPYGATKAGIVNLTETLAFEWASDDVRVNAVAPGLIATERNVREAPMDVPPADEIDRDRVARRYGTPEEIADAVQFLASPAASFVTGAVLPAAGPPRLERQLEVHEFGPGESAWL